VPHPNATNAYDNDDFNAAFLLDPGGLFAGIFHKQKLVIFGEYIPLVRWLPFVKWFTPITGGFAAGNEPVQFVMERRAPPRLEVQLNTNPAETVPGVPFRVKTSPLICFEDMFPQLARRAGPGDTDFLVNLTNDGWFGQSAEQWQQMAAASFAPWKTACRSSAAATTASPAGLTPWPRPRNLPRQQREFMAWAR